VEDWFTFYADHFDCPIVGIQPPRHLQTQFIQEQLEQQFGVDIDIIN